MLFRLCDAEDFRQPGMPCRQEMAVMMENDWGRGRGCFRRVARAGPLEKVTFQLNPEW